MVSPKYLFQGFINFSSSGMSVLSKCTIKIPANTGSRGDPMATLDQEEIPWQHHLLVGKYYFKK